MSRVNYAKIRNLQKNSNGKESIFPKTQAIDSASAQSPDSNYMNFGDQTPYPGTTTEKTEAGRVLDLFGDNVVTDNIDYINNLLKSQLTETAAPKNQQRRKRQNRQDIRETNSTQMTEEARSPEAILLNPQFNSPALEFQKEPNLDTNLSPIPSVYPEKIEIQISGSILESADIVSKAKAGKFSSTLVSKQDLEIQDLPNQSDGYDVGKRSMSVEDIRITKKDFNKGKEPSKDLCLLTTDYEMRGEAQSNLEKSSKSINQETGISNNSNISRTEFSSSLNQYIDYFQKSDSQHFRTLKASQYFYNGSQKGQSHRAGQASNAENEALKNQVKKLKAKVEDLQLMNELLTKERKLLKEKEEDLIYKADSAMSELATTKKKAKQYKEKLKNTQELLQKEKLENESNLLALRRVLSNNINTVLEYKINNYMHPSGKEKYYRDKNTSIVTAPDLEHHDKKKLAKDKDKRRNFSTNTNAFFNINKTQSSIGNSTEYNSVKKAKAQNIKEKTSPLLSQKDPSFSDVEEREFQEKMNRLSQCDDMEDDYWTRNKKASQFSMPQSDFDSSSEPFPDEFHSSHNGNKNETAKRIKQIKQLQDQLTQLIEQDEITTPSDKWDFSKATSQRNIKTSPNRKHKGHTASLYEAESKYDSFSAMANVNSKYERSKLLQSLDETPGTIEYLKNHPLYSVQKTDSRYWKI